jgi:hypothetical protein
MKVKATKTFVSGRVSMNAGETADLPAAKAEKLISIGFASPVRSKSTEPGQPGPESSPSEKSGETAAPKKKPSKAPQKAAQKAAK